MSGCMLVGGRVHVGSGRQKVPGLVLANPLVRN